MIEILSSGFRITALFLIVSFGINFYRFETYSFRKNILFLFLLTLMGYLLAYWEPVQNKKLLFQITFTFSVALPFAFWLAAKALFDDDFSWSAKYWILVFLVPVGLNVLYHLNKTVHADFYGTFHVVPYLASGGFIIMVIYEAVKNKENDLVVSRLEKRNIFVIFSSFMALFAMYFFFVEDPLKLPEKFELFQITVICVFVFLFLNSQLQYKNLWKAEQKEKGGGNANVLIRKRIIKKIIPLFEDEKLYVAERMTISRLSEQINEKEYQVRKAINDELGYTNFNAFLNHYRIQEACRLIGNDHEKMLTFQEIAFQMGYQSVATFNRAFKNETGKTPGEYSRSL